MSIKLVTAKDLEKPFPWISAWTWNRRVLTGALPLEHPSTGSGIPNMFRHPQEVVHGLAIDTMSSFGAFNVALQRPLKPKRPPAEDPRQGKQKPSVATGQAIGTWVGYREPFRDEAGNLFVRAGGLNGVSGPEKTSNLIDFDYGFYERWDYRVVIEIQLRNDHLPGANIPEPQRSGPGRFHVITFAPEVFEDEPFIDKELKYWRDPAKAHINKMAPARAFIRVRQLYDLAVEAFGKPE